VTSTIQNIFSPDLQSVSGRKYYTEVQRQSCSSNKSWISISDNYKVLVHPKLKDFNPNSGTRQYENREIHLPANEKFYPSGYSLSEHRKRFGFNGLFFAIKDLAFASPQLIYLKTILL